MGTFDEAPTFKNHWATDKPRQTPPDHEFQREYLGEWKEPRPGPYAVGRVTQSCALCSAPIDISRCTPDQYEATMAAHHAVCPKRPIEVGETVRIVRTTNPRMHGAPGVVIEFDERDADMPYRVGVDGEDYEEWWCNEVERIQRPAAVLATVPVFPAGADRAHPCPTCSRAWGEHCGIACGITFADHYAGLCRGPVPTTPPAPMLLDGLDREWCLARWMENRLAVEGRCAPPNALTPAQIATGRALWLERYGALRADALRVKVAADREAERNRVRVTPEAEPWE